MVKVKDKLFDICPSWAYRLYRWIRYRPRWIKRWFIRANGHVPDSDCWEFNDTLARSIEEGLSWMLYRGNSATWIGCRESELKQRSDLIYIKNVMSDFLRYHHEDYDLIHDPDVWQEHERNLQKAMALLAKYWWGLWD